MCTSREEIAENGRGDPLNQRPMQDRTASTSQKRSEAEGWSHQQIQHW